MLLIQHWLVSHFLSTPTSSFGDADHSTKVKQMEGSGKGKLWHAQGSINLGPAQVCCRGTEKMRQNRTVGSHRTWAPWGERERVKWCWFSGVNGNVWDNVMNVCRKHHRCSHPDLTQRVQARKGCSQPLPFSAVLAEMSGWCDEPVKEIELA